MEVNKISIIIINWNGIKWLSKCLTSLQNQTYTNYEIIIVDNSSTDSSVQFIRDQYPKVKLILSEKNLGFAGGNNLAISNSNSEYILLMNNDTWVKSDFVQNLYDAYKDNKYDVISPIEVDYYGKNIKLFSARIDPLGNSKFNTYNDYNKIRDNNFYLNGSCLFFKRELYLETGGLDNNFFMYFEETDWFWRLNLLNKSFAPINNIYLYHAGAGSTGTGIKYRNFLWKNQNCLQMLLKNFSFLTLLFILPLYLIQNILEMLFFLLILKPRISLTYIYGLFFNIKNLKQIMIRRKWIQSNRILNDRQILNKMFIGFAKYYQFKNFYFKK